MKLLLSSTRHSSARLKIFFDQLKLPGMHPMAYQSIFKQPVEWLDGPEALTFQCDALNLAAACVRKYLRRELEWFHTQIPAFTFEGFHRVIEANRGGLTVLLPFWCDGEPQKEARNRQHMHVIDVSPTGYFRKNV